MGHSANVLRSINMRDNEKDKDGGKFERNNCCLCYILAKDKWWRGNNNNQLLSSVVKLDPLLHTHLNGAICHEKMVRVIVPLGRRCTEWDMLLSCTVKLNDSICFPDGCLANNCGCSMLWQYNSNKTNVQHHRLTNLVLEAKKCKQVIIKTPNYSLLSCTNNFLIIR